MSVPVHIYDEVTEILSALRGPLEAALMQAEERGADRIRATITQALSPSGDFLRSVPEQRTRERNRLPLIEQDEASKAPRGAVPDAIIAALTKEPGLQIGELVDRVSAKHPNISSKSVRNTVLRQLDELFERTGRHGSYRWYVKGQAPNLLRAAE